MLRYINQTPKKAGQTGNAELSRIVSAAVVNKRFCSQLLTDPSAAISQGYCGEPFRLSGEQKVSIGKIREDSLERFAAQLAQL